MNLANPKLHYELQNFARSYLPNEEDAKEVVQEVLTDCLYKSEKPIDRPYLFKAIKNRSLNKKRTMSRFLKLKNILELSLPKWSLPFKTQSTPFAEMIAGLPEIYREILILRIKKSLSQREIASKLNIPLGTVKSRIHTALEKLRKNIGKDHLNFSNPSKETKSP